MRAELGAEDIRAGEIEGMKGQQVLCRRCEKQGHGEKEAGIRGAKKIARVQEKETQARP